MTDADRPRFLAAMKVLADTYRHKPTDAWFAGYWLGLGDLEIGAVEAAVAEALKRGSEFLPPPGVVRGYTEQSPEDEAAEAWEHTRREIARVGWCGSPKLDARSARAMYALGGWQRLCACESRELDFLRKAFIEVYSGAQNTESRERLLEATNATPAFTSYVAGLVKVPR